MNFIIRIKIITILGLILLFIGKISLIINALLFYTKNLSSKDAIPLILFSIILMIYGFILLIFGLIILIYNYINKRNNNLNQNEGYIDLYNI